MTKIYYLLIKYLLLPNIKTQSRHSLEIHPIIHKHTVAWITFTIGSVLTRLESFTVTYTHTNTLTHTLHTLNACYTLSLVCFPPGQVKTQETDQGLISLLKWYQNISVQPLWCFKAVVKALKSSLKNSFCSVFQVTWIFALEVFSSAWARPLDLLTPEHGTSFLGREEANSVSNMPITSRRSCW